MVISNQMEIIIHWPKYQNSDHLEVASANISRAYLLMYVYIKPGTGEAVCD